MMASAVPKRTTLMTPLVTTAGVLGIIQGLGWILCSISGILFYTDIIPTASTSGIGYSIYSLYLDKKNTSERIIGPSQFSYFLYIYLAFSFCWLLISSVLLWASITGKGHKFYGKASGGWTLITGLLSLLDLILVGLISYDYDQFKYKTNPDPTEVTAIGIVITLAARGFVLWIVNVAFAIILGKYCYKLHKQDAGNRNGAPIDAYASGPVPWLDPSLYNDSGNCYNNKAYIEDDAPPTGPGFMENRDTHANRYPNNNNRVNNTREFPQVSLNKPNDGNYYWNNRNQNKFNPRPYPEADPIRPYAQTAPVRTAKIGRQAGQRSPPLHVPPPFIPDPDYSPPGSPKVRGVLRPKSNYANYNMY